MPHIIPWIPTEYLLGIMGENRLSIKKLHLIKPSGWGILKSMHPLAPPQPGAYFWNSLLFSSYP
jgi:hypothetical protein